MKQHGMIDLGLGLLDWVTWGAPWHTLWKYFEFNILTGGSEKFGTKPWWWYLPTLAGMVPLLLAWHFGHAWSVLTRLRSRSPLISLAEK